MPDSPTAWPHGAVTVVVSAGQSRNPEKRELEAQVAELAAGVAGVRVLRVPHLYDLAPQGESFAAMQEVSGDLVLISWLYDRAAHWVLDRNGVRGQVGHIELTLEDDEEQEANLDEEAGEDERVIESQPRPARHIYCLDFRASASPGAFVDEVRRIVAEAPVSLVPDASDETTSSPLTLETLQRFAQPTNDTFVGNVSEAPPQLLGTAAVQSIDEHPGRRWYPVIDFSRCTNCMECIDFCLFGVYGVDSLETIVVEQADNCRKGCPACSRVCPQNAIIFPQHKTPAIAGAPVDTGGLKIDLSKLFGAPESDEDAAAVAARERDEQLILAGREAVGAPRGVQERLADRDSERPSDELDGLLDELDSLDL